MDDVARVRPRQRQRDLDCDVYRVPDRHGSTLDPILERLPVVIGHREEDSMVWRFIDFVDGADVGVVECGRGLCLKPEAIVRLLVSSVVRQKKLERLNRGGMSKNFLGRWVWAGERRAGGSSGLAAAISPSWTDQYRQVSQNDRA
jgi:hypothetical protein